MIPIGWVLGLAWVSILLPVALFHPRALLRWSILGTLLLISINPVLRFTYKGIPIYVADLLVLTAVPVAMTQRIPLSRAVKLFLVFGVLSVPAVLFQIADLHLVAEPLYGFARNTIAVLVAVPVLVATQDDPGFIRRMVGILVLGSTITSVIAALQVWSGSSDLAANWISALSPDFAPVAYGVYSGRAFAFFTAPTTLSGFLVVTLVLGLSLMRSGNIRTAGRLALAVCLGIVAVGLLATVSRQWVPALIFALAILRFAMPKGVRQRRLAAVVLVCAIPVGVVVGSGLDRQYLAERFTQLARGDQNLRLRLERQNDFFSQPRDVPRFVFGRGFATQDIIARGLVQSDEATLLSQGYSDNSFLLVALNSGVLAALVYGLTLLFILRNLFVICRRGPEVLRPLSTIVLGGVLAATILHLGDNYFSEAVFMKMIFWALMGMAAGLNLASRASAKEKDAEIPRLEPERVR